MYPSPLLWISKEHNGILSNGRQAAPTVAPTRRWRSEPLLRDFEFNGDFSTTGRQGTVNYGAGLKITLTQNPLETAQRGPNQNQNNASDHNGEVRKAQPGLVASNQPLAFGRNHPRHD
jgi:hypothetical protein